MLNVCVFVLLDTRSVELGVSGNCPSSSGLCCSAQPAQTLQWFARSHPNVVASCAPPASSTTDLTEFSNGLPPRCGCMHDARSQRFSILFCFPSLTSYLCVSQWVRCLPLRLVPDVTSQQVQSASPCLPHRGTYWAVVGQLPALAPCAKRHKSPSSVGAPRLPVSCGRYEKVGEVLRKKVLSQRCVCVCVSCYCGIIRDPAVPTSCLGDQ